MAVPLVTRNVLIVCFCGGAVAGDYSSAVACLVRNRGEAGLQACERSPLTQSRHIYRSALTLALEGAGHSAPLVLRDCSE